VKGQGHDETKYGQKAIRIDRRVAYLCCWWFFVVVGESLALLAVCEDDE